MLKLRSPLSFVSMDPVRNQGKRVTRRAAAALSLATARHAAPAQMLSSYNFLPRKQYSTS